MQNQPLQYSRAAHSFAEKNKNHPRKRKYAVHLLLSDAPLMARMFCWLHLILDLDFVGPPDLQLVLVQNAFLAVGSGKGVRLLRWHCRSGARLVAVGLLGVGRLVVALAGRHQLEFLQHDFQHRLECGNACCDHDHVGLDTRLG